MSRRKVKGIMCSVRGLPGPEESVISCCKKRCKRDRGIRCYDVVCSPLHPCHRTLNSNIPEKIFKPISLPYNPRRLGLTSIIVTATYLKLLKKSDHSCGILNPSDGFFYISRNPFFVFLVYIHPYFEILDLFARRRLTQQVQRVCLICFGDCICH